jgi:hypothetical protein
MVRPELTAARTCALAIALPPIVVTAIATAMLLLAAAGDHPFWSEPRVTLADAAAAGDHALVLRMIRQGHDPNRGTGRHTPIEYALERSDTRLVRLLLAHGVVLDDKSRRDLACRAARQGGGEIYALLRDGRPWTCEGPP